MTGISQQFCVRWNSHLGSLGAAFPQLLAGQQFVDVTLACDGHQVHCHRLVLAACSSYFESLLSENPCKHPIIILPKEIKLWEIHALVDFMYKGQVNVSQAGLPQLLKCAETLQIRGLCGTDSTLNEVANGKIDRCEPNPLSSNCSPNFNFSSIFATNLLNTNYQSDDEQTFRQQHSDMQRAAFDGDNNTKTTTAAHHRSTENLIKTKSHKTAHNNDKKTKELTKELTNPMLSTNKISLKRFSENEASNTCSSELNIKCEELDSDANAVDEGMDDDLDEHSNSKQSADVEQNDAVVDNDLHIVGIESNAHIHNQIATENSISITRSEAIDDVNTCYSPNWRLTDDVDRDERYKQIQDGNHDNECDVSAAKLPTSLKFNRNTMSISVKRTTTKTNDESSAKQLKSTSRMSNQRAVDEVNEHIICSPSFDPIDSDANQCIDTETDTIQSKFEPFNLDCLNFNKSHGIRYHSVDNDNVNGVDESNATDEPNERLMELFRNKDPLRSAVVLRSPRANQPRTYTKDALYSALMDVKSGESIYRASQIHGVPRKTLRNWMKRWHIKSVYPMPYQLKKAAEKKRQHTEAHTSTAPPIDLSEKYAMANVVCEYADESPTRPTSSHMEDHPDYSGRSMSPPAKRFVSENSYYSGMSEPGRRIRRSESLLRQAADNVSKGQTFQTVSDMFQIPISTIRFFMARKGILPRRKRGRASTAPIDIEEVNTSPHQRQNIANDVESSNINTLDNSQS